MRRRLIILLVVHALLALSARLVRLIPPEPAYVPLLVLIAGVAYAQQMLIAFWLALGDARLSRRIALAAALTGYLGVVHSLGTGTVWRFLSNLGEFAVVVGFFCGVYLAMGRWYLIRRIVEDEQVPQRPARFQFSLLHLLVVMSLVCVTVSLIRAAGGPGGLEGWGDIALVGLLGLTFALDAACAVWATLAIVGYMRKLMALAAVTLLLGIAVALGMVNQLSGAPIPLNWLVLTWPLIMVTITVVIVASLLVVRSCGYRLVPRIAA
jgi:hypothetical protein